MDESEKDEQTDAARSKDGFVLFMRSHSSAGLSSWLKVVYIFGAGVLGGVTARGRVAASGMGERRCADVGCIVGLDNSAGTSDISIVGMMVVVSLLARLERLLEHTGVEEPICQKNEAYQLATYSVHWQ